MKKALLSLFCLVSVFCFADDSLVGKYKLSSVYNSEFDINSYEDTTQSFILIKCHGNIWNDYNGIKIQREDLDGFVDSLKADKNKYIEWSKTAKDNNIKGFTKNFPYNLYSGRVIWTLKDKAYYSGKLIFIPYFKVDDDGKCLFVIYANVKDVNDARYYAWIDIVFSNVIEIDNFIKLIEPSNIDKFNHRDDLFK